MSLTTRRPADRFQVVVNNSTSCIARKVSNYAENSTVSGEDRKVVLFVSAVTRYICQMRSAPVVNRTRLVEYATCTRYR